MVTSFGNDYTISDAMITPATKVAFGDFQCNAAFSIAKPLGKTPRDIAKVMLESLDVSEVFEAPTIAGIDSQVLLLLKNRLTNIQR